MKLTETQTKSLLKRFDPVEPVDIDKVIAEIIKKRLNELSKNLRQELLQTLKVEDGEIGERGVDGEDGKQGKVGERGKDGRDGKDGKNGIDGKDGNDGKDGTNGVDGASLITTIYSDEEKDSRWCFWYYNKPENICR